MALEGIAKLGESDLETVAGGAISDIWEGVSEAFTQNFGLDISSSIRAYVEMCGHSDLISARHWRLGNLCGRVISMSTLLVIGYQGGRIFHRRKKIARYFGEKLIKWFAHK